VQCPLNDMLSSVHSSVDGRIQAGPEIDTEP